MNIANRIQAYSASHPLSLNRKIDSYLSENLPDMMDQYKIADRNDLKDIEDNFNKLEGRLDELEKWKPGFSEDLKNARTRVDRLKIKYGVE
jgi:soluble cytochrome b562